MSDSPLSDTLVFDRVDHYFGPAQALDQVSLRLMQGEVMCLLGPSGCGKTTALRIAAGLEKPSSGRVHLAGRTVCDNTYSVPPEERGVGFLFQDYALFPHLNVADNVMFGLKHLPAAERRRRTHDWLKRVDLWERRDAYPHTLSGGEQQRVALARAMAPQPAVLLLDEPFSNLDTGLRRRVRDDVLTVIKDCAGTAALMVTHDPEEALYMGDKIALMSNGSIAQQGTPDGLYMRPEDASVAAFFGEVNRISVQVLDGKVQTPFGALPATAMADGAKAEVLLRTEGLTLHAPNESTPTAVIAQVRRLGQLSQMRLDMENSATGPIELTAHVLGASAYRCGDRVGVALDKTLAFVFTA